MGEFYIDKVINNEYAITNCVYIKTKSLNYIEIDNGIKHGIFKVLEDKTIDSKQVLLNNFQRLWFNNATGTKVQIKSISIGLIEPIKNITFYVSSLSPNKNPLIEITDDVIAQIKTELNGIPVQNDLKLIGYNKKITLMPIDLNMSDSNKIINMDTTINIISTCKNIIVETSDTKELFKGDFNFIEMGIGGLDKQFEIIFRRAFSSRLIPEKISRVPR